MKYLLRIIAIVSLVLLFGGIGYKGMCHYIVNKCDNIEQIVDENLGLLKEKITENQRAEITMLIALEEYMKELRINNNDIYLSDIETYLVQSISDNLDAYTEEYLENNYEYYYEYEYDDSYYEDNYDAEYNYYYSYPDMINENISEVLKALKGIVSTEDYFDLKSLSEEYIDGYDTYYEIYYILDNYDSLDNDVITMALTTNNYNKISAIYSVKDDFTLDYYPVYPIMTEVNEEDNNEFEIIWNRIKELIPEEDLQNFKQIYFTSDGEYDELASVTPMDESGYSWILAVDYIDVKLENEESLFYETIIHEYFHYLSLNGGQVTYTEDYDMNNYCEEGIVSNSDSYINEFYKKFWVNILRDNSVYYDSYYFYLRHSNEFVTEYAATDPAEDIAESFAYFVLSEKLEGKSIKDEKIRFFYDYPELVELREELRKNIISDFGSNDLFY